MTKREREFVDVRHTPWTEVIPSVPGLFERVLAPDTAAEGVATRILRFDPGTNTSPMGVQRHEFWEEVYILEGSLHDLVLDETFHAGGYACRPPRMPHGPWTSAEGCLTFEVRYLAG